MKFDSNFFNLPIKTTGVVNPVRKYLTVEERDQLPKGALAPLDLAEDGRQQVEIEATRIEEAWGKQHTETYNVRIPVDGDAEKFVLPAGEYRFEALEVEVWNAKGKRELGSRWSAKGIIDQAAKAKAS